MRPAATLCRHACSQLNVKPSLGVPVYEYESVVALASHEPPQAWSTCRRGSRDRPSQQARGIVRLTVEEPSDRL